MSYSNAAQYYDKFYENKNYEAEAQKIVSIVGSEPDSQDLALLDVACGTGLHIEHLKRHFDVEGLDICTELLEFARARNPEITFHQGDMTDFDLGRRYDVITCLFSAIGYVKTLENLSATIRRMIEHLNPGGTLIIEPWFTPDAWMPDTVHSNIIDEPELKIVRMNTSYADGRLSYFDMHYLIGTPEGTNHIVERHELGLFTVPETISVLEEAGLAVEYDPEGFIGRGLYIGKRK